MMTWLLVRVPLLLRGVLASLAVLVGVGLGAAWPASSVHASSNWWWRRLMAQDIAYLHTAASRCVNDAPMPPACWLCVARSTRSS
jgi:hypothetical protein